MSEHPLLNRIIAQLCDLGFRKRTKQIATIDLGGDWMGWLGLNASSRSGGPGGLSLTPIVGVRHHLIEKCIARGLRVRPSSYTPPTLSEPLRYLVPIQERKGWVATSSEDCIDLVASDVIEMALRYGLPYMNYHADLSVLSGALERAAAHNQQAAYRWPTSLWIAGEDDLLSDAAAKVVGALDGRSDKAADELRHYLNWLEFRGAEDWD